MLQPIPARSLFRLLEMPLALAMIGSGLALASTPFQPTDEGVWLPIALFLVGAPVTVFGVLAMIHAVTGCFPEWVVGAGQDSSDGDAV